MAIMSCRGAGHGCRCAPSAPLVVDPAELASVEMVPAGPGGRVLAPVLVLPGVRVRVDAPIPNTQAARWWHELGMAALLVAMHYDEAGSESAR